MAVRMEGKTVRWGPLGEVAVQFFHPSTCTSPRIHRYCHCLGPDWQVQMRLCNQLEVRKLS